MLRKYLATAAVSFLLAACCGYSFAQPARMRPLADELPGQRPTTIPPPPASITFQSEGLRTHVDRVDIGIQVGGDDIFWTPGDRLLMPYVAREGSMLLIGNNLKWAAPGVLTLRTARNEYNFAAADSLVAWAEAHGMKIKAHTLVWGEALPAWLTTGAYSRDEIVQILKEHIQTVVGRYKGRIHVWDVVNEAIDFNGAYKSNFWYQKIGPDYIEMAFRWAHDADPSALLFMNEDGTEGLGAGSDEFLKKVQALVVKGVPIHGVGLQTHVNLAYETLGGASTAKPAELAANVQRLGAVGLQVHISEVDVRIAVPATPSDLSKQADVYTALYKTCADNRACTAFLTWGVTDKWSWISRGFPGQGSALLLDEAYNPKPAYWALRDLLRANSDKCFSWAESRYGEVLQPPNPTAATFEDFYYRYYPLTRNYVGVRQGDVYYWKPEEMTAPLPVMSLKNCIDNATGRGG